MQLGMPIGCCDVIFFPYLMSLDKALIPASDDRIMEPRDLKCGNQSENVNDKFMVRMVI